MERVMGTRTVRITKKAHDLVISKGKYGESFAAVLDRLLKIKGRTRANNKRKPSNRARR